MFCIYLRAYNFICVQVFIQVHTVRVWMIWMNVFMRYCAFAFGIHHTGIHHVHPENFEFIAFLCSFLIYFGVQSTLKFGLGNDENNKNSKYSKMWFTNAERDPLVSFLCFTNVICDPFHIIFTLVVVAFVAATAVVVISLPFFSMLSCTFALNASNHIQCAYACIF